VTTPKRYSIYLSQNPIESDSLWTVMKNIGCNKRVNGFRLFSKILPTRTELCFEYFEVVKKTTFRLSRIADSTIRANKLLKDDINEHGHSQGDLLIFRNPSMAIWAFWGVKDKIQTYYYPQKYLFNVRFHELSFSMWQINPVVHSDFCFSFFKTLLYCPSNTTEPDQKLEAATGRDVADKIWILARHPKSCGSKAIPIFQEERLWPGLLFLGNFVFNRPLGPKGYLLAIPKAHWLVVRYLQNLLS
jgi:Pyruvate/2-oxoacid:ferredoxin oxidoreductase delta subunit